MNRLGKITMDGLITQNAAFRLALGTCATLGMTATALGGLGMGLSVAVVLLLSNTLISLLKKIIPNAVRIPCYIVVIATLVTLLRMVLEKYLPDLYDIMGIYLPLIVVNCIILGRAESFASKRPVIDSAVDGAAIGVGYAAALLLMGMVRELFGSGSLFGVRLLNLSCGFFQNAAGAFFVYGIFFALFSFINDKTEKAKRKKRARELRHAGSGAPSATLGKEDGNV